MPSPPNSKVVFLLLALFLLSLVGLVSYSCCTTKGKVQKNQVQQKKKKETKSNLCKSYQKYVKDRTLEQLSRQINTPKAAQKFIDSICYKKDKKLYGGNHWAPFKYTHENGGYGDCDDIAVTALTVLADDIERLRVLVIEDKDSKHAVALYEKNSKYGSIGNRKKDPQPPKFESLLNLTHKLGYKKYEVFEFENKHTLLQRDENINLKKEAEKIKSSQKEEK